MVIAEYVMSGSHSTMITWILWNINLFPFKLLKQKFRLKVHLAETISVFYLVQGILLAIKYKPQLTAANHLQTIPPPKNPKAQHII